MSESRRLLDALKRVLRQRGWRYVDLAGALALSEVTVKRMFASGRVDLARLERICDVLDIGLLDLVRIAARTRQASRHLTEQQEQALADNPRLLMVFHLLCNDYDAAAIAREFKLAKPATVRFLAQLDRLRLIELLPGERVRLRVHRQVQWRPSGPVRQRYAGLALQEFLAGGFDGLQDCLVLEVKEMQPASATVMRGKLRQLQQEFNALVEMDAAMPASERISVGLVLALRPWVFSLYDALRRNDEATVPATARRNAATRRLASPGVAPAPAGSPPHPAARSRRAG